MQTKTDRIVGMYNHFEDYDRLGKANEIFACFLQAMEYHPSVQMSQLLGVGAQHSTPEKHEHMNAIDLKNAEDLVIIAVELCYETQLFDWTVLNPVNFKMISMLEHAKAYYQSPG